MVWVGELLLWTILSALGAVGLTIMLRNAPVVRGWVQGGKKPWACNVCMPLYTSAMMLAVPCFLLRDWTYVVAFPATYFVAHWVLHVISRPPPGLPPMFLPEDEDETDS